MYFTELSFLWAGFIYKKNVYLLKGIDSFPDGHQFCQQFFK